MIIRKEADGSLILMGQTDHSKLVGNLAAHWGNQQFAVPRPYDSVVRAATFHDFGWLRYETCPIINQETGAPYEFRGMPFNPKQIEAYQWCVDWLADVDPYSALIVSMHRTGLYKGRYDTITHPAGGRAGGYTPTNPRPEIQEFIDRNETWQGQTVQSLDEDEVWTNYRLQQVWDLLGLYFCCQEPYDHYIEPVPTCYGRERTEGARMAMNPLPEGRVAFEPYPFDVRPLRIRIACKRLADATYPDLDAFRRSYFQAAPEVLEYQLV